MYAIDLFDHYWIGFRSKIQKLKDWFQLIHPNRIPSPRLIDSFSKYSIKPFSSLDQFSQQDPPIDRPTGYYDRGKRDLSVEPHRIRGVRLNWSLLKHSHRRSLRVPNVGLDQRKSYPIIAATHSRFPRTAIRAQSTSTSTPCFSRRSQLFDIAR